jgi:predicted HAD superfamily Cof-like phosphohydrolase
MHLTDKDEAALCHVLDKLEIIQQSEYPGDDEIEIVKAVKSSIKSEVEMVQEFHITFGHPVAVEPVEKINEQRLSDRIGYILEEVRELAEAGGPAVFHKFAIHIAKMYEFCEQKTYTQPESLVDCLDALIDINYFTAGTVVELGLQKQFREGFELVHENNMSKICRTTDETNRTAEMYNGLGVDFTTESILGKDELMILFKRADNNKVLKPAHYQPVDLTVLFNSQAPEILPAD